MTDYNNLTLEVYRSGTTPIADPLGELTRIQGLNFRTFYPGGLYGDASFFVPRRVVDWWELNGAQRVTFRNDLRQCYEGYIANLQSAVDTPQGVEVRLLGATGHILMRHPIRKRWADDRITDDVWRYQSDAATYTATEKCFVDRSERLRFTPKAEAWTSGQFAAVRYTMPTGQTVARVTYDYQLAEGGQAWEISAWRSTDASSWTQMTNASGESYATGTTTVVTSSATGAIDVTLGTPSQYLEFRFYARGNQTPTSDGTYFGEYSAVKVYSETGNIYMDEIAKDILGYVTAFNSETRFIAAAGTPLSLVPFIADNFESAADILNEATSQGDGVYGRWAWYCIGSERAFVPDGKPLLVVASYVNTNNYEYAVRLDDPNLVLPFTVSQDFDSIANWIVVQYNDLEGVRQWRSPDDNAALRDDTSITDYGRRGEIVTIPGASTSSIADAVGQRYLATFKDPQYRLTSPVTVSEFIRGKGSMVYPASEIRAGYRLRIENYIQDVTGTGQGLTFVVTGTSYDHDSQTCQLTTGSPEAPLILRFHPMEAMPGVRDRPQEGTGGTTTTTGGGGRTITGKMLKKMGLTRAQWNKMTPQQRRRAKKKAGL